MMCQPAVRSFLSTLSLRRATSVLWMARCHLLFLSTLSLRRATSNQPATIHTWRISIHALLAESDHCDTLSALAPEEFLSTLSLRRATLTVGVVELDSNIFLSTLSLRRATRLVVTIKRLYFNFYPRSPCGERHHSVHSSSQ